jgi:hypothetical protein
MLDDPTPATAAAQPFDPLSAAPGWHMMASVEHHAKKRLNPGLFHNCNSRTKPRRQALIAAPAIRICTVRHRQNAGPRMTPADRTMPRRILIASSAANARCGSVGRSTVLIFLRKSSAHPHQGFVARTTVSAAKFKASNHTFSNSLIRLGPERSHQSKF